MIADNKSLTVNGTMTTVSTSTSAYTYGVGAAINFGATGVFNLSGTTGGHIPLGTWDAASTLNISLTGNPGIIADRGQTFGIVNWNCPNQTTGYTLGTSTPSAFTTLGLFTISSTGSGSVITGATTLTTMTLAALTVSGNSVMYIAGTGATGNRTLIVNGDYTQSGTSTFHITGNSFSGFFEVKGNFNKSAGTITNSGGSTGTANIKLNGNSAQTFSTNSLTNDINLEVSNPSGAVLNSSVILNGSLLLTQGVLNNSSNNITVANGKTIFRYEGSLSAAPSFGTLSTHRVNVNITGNCTASNELAGTTGGIGTLTVNNNATYTLNADRTLDAVSVASGATVDAATYVLTPRLSGTATIAGTFKTANLNGFSGTATAAISSTNSPAFTLTGSTIEFNAASVSQVITSRSDYNNLTISGSVTKSLGSSLTVGGALSLTSSSDILSIGSNTLTLNGTVTGSGLLRGSSSSNISIGGTGSLGTLNFDQSSDGTTNVLNNITVNRSSGTLALGNKLVVINTYTPTAGTLTSNGFLHLRSDATNTARVAAGSSGGGYISGDVTVERYISANSNRAWRLVTPDVTTTTNINANWQEGKVNTVLNTNVPSDAAGYGTHITGTGGSTNGFDVTQNNAASLYDWNQSAQDWSVMGNTNVNTLDAKKGYLLFVRGNRDNINTINTTTGSSNVTLRAKGTLAQGDQSFTGLATAGNFSLVTNPFAAPVDWTSIISTNTSNFNNSVTIWDPNVNTRGGFVTVNNIGINSNVSSAITQDIQSGQAFFVQTKTGVTGNPTFTILESHKSSTNNLDVFRSGNQTEKLSIQLKYTANNIDRTADGVVAVFNNNYSSAVDDNDAEQIANWDEDIALLRNGKELSIEARPLADNNDTLYLQTNRLRTAQGTYRWEITPQNIQTVGMEAYLSDNFTNTLTPVSLTANTVINFTVNSNVASTASNRFSIVFKNNAALPVTVTQLKAYQKNSGVNVDWTTTQEQNIAAYEVEKSNDAQQFTQLTTEQAKGNNNNTNNNYTAIDAIPQTGNNYYRIKIIEKNGSNSYTQVVRVTIDKTGNSSISVYPNPVKNNSMNVQLQNIEKGKYTLQLISQTGQLVQEDQLEHNGGSSSQTILLSKHISSGIYQLS